MGSWRACATGNATRWKWRTTSTPEAEWSSSGTRSDVGREAALRSKPALRSSTRSTATRLSRFRDTWTAGRPSKPRGCRNRALARESGCFQGLGSLSELLFADALAVAEGVDVEEALLVGDSAASAA